MGHVVRNFGPKRAAIKPLVLEYLHDCNDNTVSKFAFRNIHTRGNLVLTDVFYNNIRYAHDYAELSRDHRYFCKIVAEDLRDAAGRSVYFDMIDGRLKIIT